MLTADELAELADLKAPLVRLRGQWIELDARRLAAGLKLVGRTEQATVGELLRLGLGVARRARTGLPVEASTRRRLARRPAGRAGRAAARAGRGARRVRRHAAPVPGAGPGLAGLPAAARARRRPGRRHGPGQDGAAARAAGTATQRRPGRRLLVCPMSLVGNWQREAARFTPELRVHVHHGAERARGKRVHRRRSPARTWSSPPTRWPPATPPTCARSTGAGWWSTRRRRSRTPPPGRPPRSGRCRPRHRIAVTGTPVENRLADLWSILEFANPGLLGTAAAFKKRYAEPIERHGDEDAAERLRRFTGPFILRRRQDRHVDHRRPAGQARDGRASAT